MYLSKCLRVLVVEDLIMRGIQSVRLQMIGLRLLAYFNISLAQGDETSNNPPSTSISLTHFSPSPSASSYLVAYVGEICGRAMMLSFI